MNSCRVMRRCWSFVRHLDCPFLDKKNRNRLLVIWPNPCEDFVRLGQRNRLASLRLEAVAQPFYIYISTVWLFFMTCQSIYSVWGSLWFDSQSPVSFDTGAALIRRRSNGVKDAGGHLCCRLLLRWLSWPVARTVDVCYLCKQKDKRRNIRLTDFYLYIIINRCFFWNGIGR